jgi:hypothetical protein
MSRYKGHFSPKLIERDFPHIVETIVPLGGFGKTLDAIRISHPAMESEPSIQPDDATRIAAIIALLIAK